MIKGAFTALITPFINDTVDYDGFDRLLEFQVVNNITGVLAVGTTGESPTLGWDEHNRIIETTARKTKGRCICIAGTGSNNTRESLEATRHAAEAGVDAVLLVDPYYNGPSSLEIRREYYDPIAAAYTEIQLIPYIIPGRTGAQMAPEDLALLSEKYKNVQTVKEATGNLENMRRTRTCCGPHFSILSGDDEMTFRMMTDPGIAAAGVISVASNIAPKAVAEYVKLLEEGDREGADRINTALAPLYTLVTVKTKETTPYGEVECRARNPLAIKTLMTILGMPSGACRPPVGKMTENGVSKVIAAAKKVLAETPEILQPAAEFFNIDIAERLDDPACREGVTYAAY